MEHAAVALPVQALRGFYRTVRKVLLLQSRRSTMIVAVAVALLLLCWRRKRSRLLNSLMSMLSWMPMRKVARETTSPGTRSHGADSNASSETSWSRIVCLNDEDRSRCCARLRRHYLRRVNCDVVLWAGEQAFWAHRWWVAAFSSRLERMLQEGGDEGLRLPDVEPKIFSVLMDFIYGGPVDLDGSNVEGILELSVRLGVTALVDRCSSFLASVLSDHNACNILTVADKHKCALLRRDALLYVVMHFPRCWAESCEVSHDGEGNMHDQARPQEDKPAEGTAHQPRGRSREAFTRLPLSVLVEVLSHEGLAHDEVDVFRAAVHWLEARRRASSAGDWRDASDVVEEVMRCVRFAFMPAHVLAEEVEQHPLFASSEVCKGYVVDAYRYQALHTRRYGDGQEAFRRHAATMGRRAEPRKPAAVLAQQHQWVGPANTHGGVPASTALDTHTTSTCATEDGCDEQSHEGGSESEGAGSHVQSEHSPRQVESCSISGDKAFVDVAAWRSHVTSEWSTRREREDVSYGAALASYASLSRSVSVLV